MKSSFGSLVVVSLLMGGCAAETSSDTTDSGDPDTGSVDQGSDAGDTADAADGDDASADATDGTVDSTDGSDSADGSDAVESADAADATDGGDPTIPAGAVAIAFVADDRANRTYQDGQIQWTGSFAWDKDKNTIEPNTSWLPTEREWPRLFDDGPRSTGGHEAEGQVAADGFMSTEVFFYPAAEPTSFEYGALSEFATWIWIGPNGQFEVPAGATGRTEVPGVVFPKFGDRDLRITLDLAKIHADFKTITAETHAIYVKGTMNSWTTVQILDNGKKGDLAANDGVFTYVHSEKLGPHDGLTFAGQHVQFVFVFAFKEDDPANGQEYKFPVDALPDGVAAASGKGGTWLDEAVILEPDSYGNVKNTAVIVSGPPPECDDTHACPEGKVCESGTCVAEPECAETKPCGEGKVCESGVCVAEPECSGAKPCSGDLVCVGGGCVDEPDCSATKPCSAGNICTGGLCVPEAKPECGAEVPCDDGFICQSGKCVIDIPTGLKPAVSVVDPAKGPASGGTPVTISGVNFATGAKVMFGANEATAVAVKTVGTITAVTPPGAFGAVTVTVINPDALQGSYPGGFSYTSFPPPTLATAAPDKGQLAGGEPVTLTGTGFQPGAKVTFGLSEATQVSVAPGGASLTCLTPAGESKGAVDVTVGNPDGQSDTLVAGFNYQAPLVQYAVLMEPFDLTVKPAEALPPVNVQVYHPGVTPGEGAGEGLLVELGVGPADSMPGAAWTWTGATYQGQTGYMNNDDRWQGTFPGTLVPGSYDWAFRCSLDGETWVHADRDPSTMVYGISSAGTLTIAEPPKGLAIFEVSPAFGSILGGTKITITGQEFEAGTTVTIGGKAATDIVVVGSGALTALVPPGAAGPVTVEVSTGIKKASRTEGFRYTYVVAEVPPTDGNIASDWPASFQLADDTAAAGWDNNDLDQLYVGFDNQYVYIAITGQVEGSNAMVLFMDVDFGAGTGFVPSTLSDNAGALDNALSGAGTNVYVPGFGAEIAVGAFGGTGQAGEGLDNSGNAGVRSFASGGGDFHWLPGQVVLGPNGMEIRLDRAVVGLASSSAGHEVALYVRIVNQDGEYVSPEGLPSSTNLDGSVDTIVRLWVD